MANLTDIYKKASLVMKPAAMKEGKLYSQQPHSGAGDFTFSRANGVQTRINENGLIETVADNTPRLSYELDADGNVSECPTLLLEPTMTNNATYSNDISSWVSVGSPTITTNINVAPDGSNTADGLQDTVSNGSFKRIRRTISVSGNSTYTGSFFVKKETSETAYGGIMLDFINGTRKSTWVIFDAVNGTANNTTNSTLTPIIDIEDFGNYWRFSVTATDTGNNTSLIFAYFATMSTSSSGALTSGVGSVRTIWGAQLEQGSYPTSYIPTLGSAVTRTRDTAKIEPYSALPSDYPLTVFWEGKIDNYSISQFIFSIFGTGSNAKYLGFSWQSSTQIALFRRSSTNNDYDVVSFSSSKLTNYKVAVSFISNTEAKVYINGSLVYNLTSGLDVDYEFDSVIIGQQRVASDSGFRNSAKQFIIFNETLTDSELITLTT